MLVHGFFVPPREALDELFASMHSVRRELLREEPRKRGFLRRQGEPSVPEDVPPVLLDVAVEALRLPITAFGNLAANDLRRLVAALEEAAADWPQPTVRFSGGGALEFPGDAAVWARLDGEVEALGGIAREVTRCVERLGLFVDRRVFRPALAVATVTTSTVGEDLEAVVGALDALQGRPWTVDAVVLTTDTRADGNPQEYERIPLGPATPR